MSKGKNAKYVPAKQSNTITYILGGVAVLVVAVVVIGLVLFLGGKDSGTPPPPPGVAAAKLDQAVPSMTVGKADAPVTLDLFEDMMCPACGAMEKQYGEAITKAVNDGKVRARYHLVDFLNEQSASKNYSDRAAASLLAVAKSSLPADQKSTAWMAAHTALFANQPREQSSADHSNEDLAKIVADASKAGGVTLPTDVTDAIPQGKYIDEAAGTAKGAIDLLNATAGRASTPTVFANGNSVSLEDSSWLDKLTGNEG